MKIKNVNFTPYQFSEKVSQKKGAPKIKEKKVLAVTSGEVINKVDKYFYKRKEYLNKTYIKYEK